MSLVDGYSGNRSRISGGEGAFTLNVLIILPDGTNKKRPFDRH